MLRRMMMAWLTVAGLTAAVAAADDLERGFAQPPASARPWVYWFPLSGNLTKEGITADLEAMQRAGIGGVLYMEVDQGAPQGPADFAGPLWRELFQHVKIGWRTHPRVHFVQDGVPPQERGIFIAGDDVSWTPGWVEGAVTTGLNAVWGILKHLGGELCRDVALKLPAP